MCGHEYKVQHLPAESNTAMFGGNSNRGGPVWMPVNALIVRALGRRDLPSAPAGEAPGAHAGDSAVIGFRAVTTVADNASMSYRRERRQHAEAVALDDAIGG
jgi:hypothetical protein